MSIKAFPLSQMGNPLPRGAKVLLASSFIQSHLRCGHDGLAEKIGCPICKQGELVFAGAETVFRHKYFLLGKLAVWAFARQVNFCCSNLSCGTEYFGEVLLPRAAKKGER